MSAISPKPSAPVASQYLYPQSLPFHGTRNPVTHSGRGFRAKFASHKNRRVVRCESLLEMHFLYLAEFARNVVSFDEQPVSIAYRLNGRQRRYTPDFGFRWHDGRQWYVEVKPHELLALEKNREKFDAIGEHFRREGDTFITISEREIRHPIRMPLVRDLLRQRNDTLLEALAEMENIDLGAFSTWGELSSELGQTLATVCLAYRVIACSLLVPLQATSPISVFKEADDDALFN